MEHQRGSSQARAVAGHAAGRRDPGGDVVMQAVVAEESWSLQEQLASLSGAIQALAKGKGKDRGNGKGQGKGPTPLPPREGQEEAIPQAKAGPVTSTVPATIATSTATASSSAGPWTRRWPTRRSRLASDEVRRSRPVPSTRLGRPMMARGSGPTTPRRSWRTAPAQSGRSAHRLRASARCTRTCRRCRAPLRG